jgi:hypothetical protein
MESLKIYREKVILANELYDEIRKLIRISDDQPYRREGIQILSEPFLKGVFTLAVIGLMSAGKSAFINALLEDEDILPTGHNQTTCTLTEIVWSKEKKLVVTYGDGHDVTKKGDEILGVLKDVVAIKPKYDSLPINHINQYILDGKTLKDIIKCKDNIIKLSGRPTIDENLLTEYVQEKTKANIPVHVYMEYPLSDSFRGWRIVDTPGIGALGGIDQTTKKFLVEDQVDAAIFMFNGVEHIEYTSVNEMVKTAYAQLSDIAKERTFFVITHVGEKTCQDNLDRTIKTALDLFSQGEVAIPKERFFCVDSLLSLFYDISIIKMGLDSIRFKEYDPVETMDEKTYDCISDMIKHLDRVLRREGKEQNTENLNNKIVEIAGFKTMKKALGDFARDAKKEAYQRLIGTIIEDFNAFGSKKNEDKELYESKLTKTPAEFAAEIENKKREIERYKNEILKRYTDIVLKYSKDKLPEMFTKSLGTLEKRIKNASYYVDIDNAYNNYLDMLPIEEELVITRFTKDCEEIGSVKVSQKYPDIVIPPIDVEKAKREATQKATETIEYTTTEKKKGFGGWFKRVFGTGGYETVERTRDVLDEKKQLIEFKNEVLSQVRETLSEYSTDIHSQFFVPTGKEIQKQLDKLIAEKSREYDQICNDAASAQETQDTIDLIINEINIIKENTTNLINTTNIA